MTRQEHIDHLLKRAAECFANGDKKMGDLFTLKANNMKGK